MAEHMIDVWLYGNLAKYGGDSSCIFANVKLTVTDEITIRELLDILNMPTEERGFTFINGKLSAMPGLQPDFDSRLKDGDRVAFFHLRSMWPFQYRQGIAMTDEMSTSITERADKGITHSIKRG